MVKLLYGSGLCLSECVQLRVKDIDFAQHQIIVRDAKGMQDRVPMLPESLVKPLQEHLQRIKQLHQTDQKKGHGAVYLALSDGIGQLAPGARSGFGKAFELVGGHNILSTLLKDQIIAKVRNERKPAYFSHQSWQPPVL